nr:basic helix-loop-helix transcription factor [Loropetalum chinense var. rubrum]
MHQDYMLIAQFIHRGMAELHYRHRDMRLDVDNMSYEELLALVEHIGDVSTRLNEETILKLITGTSQDVELCCICQDYMLFAQFIHHGMAELHDRHRDMWLDVDNMSYESWDFSNSDNSGGGEEKSGKRQVKSSSNSLIVIDEESGKKRGWGDGGGGGGEVKEGKGGGAESDDHEIHIWTERERRKKMRNMFSSLHALLPQLPPKADKSTIVDEAVNYIKTLQHTLQKLQKQKLERLQGAATINYDPSSIITPQKPAYSSREAFLADQGSSSNLAITPTNSSNNALSLSRFPIVFQTWTSQNVILNICGNEAQISVCSPKKPGLLSSICFVLEKHKLEVVSAHISSDYNRSMYMIQARLANGASDQFPEAFPVEEIFKQAAGEIMFWICS